MNTKKTRTPSRTALFVTVFVTVLRIISINFEHRYEHLHEHLYESPTRGVQGRTHIFCVQGLVSSLGTKSGVLRTRCSRKRCESKGFRKVVREGVRFSICSHIPFIYMFPNRSILFPEKFFCKIQ